MRFTYKRAPRGGKLRHTVQVFSVKIAETRGDLQWPINVFGMIALRDSLDNNRNIIFGRDNCQTLTEKVRCISLPPYFFNLFAVPSHINLNFSNISYILICHIGKFYHASTHVVAVSVVSALSALVDSI